MLLHPAEQPGSPVLCLGRVGTQEHAVCQAFLVATTASTCNKHELMQCWGFQHFISESHSRVVLLGWFWARCYLKLSNIQQQLHKDGLTAPIYCRTRIQKREIPSTAFLSITHSHNAPNAFGWAYRKAAPKAPGFILHNSTNAGQVSLHTKIQRNKYKIYLV